MYQVFCMQGTPPVTWEEQDKCLHSKSSCWRLAASKETAARGSTQKKRAEHSTSSSPPR